MCCLSHRKHTDNCSAVRCLYTETFTIVGSRRKHSLSDWLAFTNLVSIFSPFCNLPFSDVLCTSERANERASSTTLAVYVRSIFRKDRTLGRISSFLPSFRINSSLLSDKISSNNFHSVYPAAYALPNLPNQ